jgi:hypothetical protein
MAQLQQIPAYDIQHNVNYQFRDANFLRTNLQDYILKFIDGDQEARRAVIYLFNQMNESNSPVLQYIAWCSGYVSGFIHNTWRRPFDENTFNNHYKPFVQCFAVTARYDSVHDFFTGRSGV